MSDDRAEEEAMWLIGRHQRLAELEDAISGRTGEGRAILTVNIIRSWSDESKLALARKISDYDALKDAVRHAWHRNHPHSPDSCDGCAGVARAAETT